MILNENIQSLLVCKICDLIYERPVKLPCGKTTCNSHLLKLNGGFLSEIDCPFCQNKHEVPTRGFYPNFHIQKQIEQRKGIDLKGDMEESLVNLDNIFTKTDQSDDFIAEHFSKIKTQINNQREIIIEQINSLTDKLLKKTQTLEFEFKEEVSHLKSLRKQCLSDFKDEVNFQFRQINLDKEKLTKKYSIVNKEATFLNDQLKDLLQNKIKSYSFVPNSINFEESLIGDIKQNNNSQGDEHKLITCHKDGSLKMRFLDGESRFDFFNGKHERNVNCILISADNKKLISGGVDGFIKICDLATGVLIKSIANVDNGKKWGIKCLINSPGSNEIFFGSNLNEIRTLDLRTYEIKRFTKKSHSKLISNLEFLTNDILLSSSTDFTIKVWSLNEKKCLQTIDFEQYEPRCLCKIDNSKFAFGISKKILVFSSNQNGIFSYFKTLLKYAYGYINELKVSTNLNLLISISNLVHLWSLDDFTCLGCLSPNDSSYPLSFETLSNYRLIILNTNDTLELWCLKTLKSMKIFNDYPSLSNKIISY